MKLFQAKVVALVATLATVVAGPAFAANAINITEVAPWGSGTAGYGADWFEITNNSTSAISLVGWKMDDNSNSFSSAVALRGVNSIAAGQSVVFLEGGSSAANDAALNASFISTWFGANAPAGLVIGDYGGSGVGLSTGADAVNLYDAGGALQASVSFSASPGGPFASFDNAAKLNGVAISQLSVAGVNGGFKAFGDAAEIGSPGSIAAVPEPASYALMLSGLGLIGCVVRRKART